MNGIGWQNSIDRSLFGGSYGSYSSRAGISGPDERRMTDEQRKRLEEQSMTPHEKKEAEKEERKRMGLREKYDPHDPTCECQTCKNRKYQDGSDEMVSFKTAQHIDPGAAAARVRGHEQEHVANAYSKAAQKGGKVLQASVSIHTAICPECGRTYVSGGTTNTQIKYYNEENPYQKDLKAQQHDKFAGWNVDYAV